jgi:hypothetical protein
VRVSDYVLIRSTSTRSPRWAETDPEKEGHQVIPFPKPTHRDQARSNAIHAAESAHTKAVVSQPMATRWAAVSQAWSAVAETFPHEDTVTEVQAVEDTNPHSGLMVLTHDERETILALRENRARVVPVRP